MRRFCYRCGSLEGEQNPLIGGLCRKCLEKQKLVELGDLNLTMCRKCGAIRVKGGWMELDFESGVRETIMDKIKVARLEGESLTFVPLSQSGGSSVNVEIKGNTNKANVTVTVYLKLSPEQGEPILQTVHPRLKIEKQVCPICRLKDSGYYEAILQVRGVPEDEEERVMRILEEETWVAQTEDRRSFITRVQETRSGFDLYVSSLGLARRLARALKKIYDVHIQESSKLVGVRNGRRRYRTSVLVRLKSTCKI